MQMSLSQSATAFSGTKCLCSGPLVEVALAVRDAIGRAEPGPVLVFEDATGRVLDLDLRGTKADLVDRLSRSPPDSDRHAASRLATPPTAPDESTAQQRGRGRPALGVIAREVTLLPRHWEWLAAQPGGASVALRKLVEHARRDAAPRQQARAAQERAYTFMAAIAGDMAGFEEATRALFADDRARFEQHVLPWPEDVRSYATRLGFEGRLPGS